MLVKSFSLSGLRLPAIALSAGIAMACGVASAQAQNAVVIVNGDPITNFDIEQRVKLIQLSNGNKPANRAEALEELINDRVKIKEAKKFNLDLPAAEVDAQYAQMGARMRLTSEQLDKVLAGRGIRPDALKSRLKADYVWSQLVRGRYGQSLIVGEKDVASAIQVKNDGKESNNFEYKMRPVVLFVSKNGGPGALEARRKEADALRTRIQSCDQAENYFRAVRDGVIKDQVAKTSADIPAPLRDMLDKTPIGQLTTPEVTRQGIEMVVLCARAPTTETAEKREARDKLFSQKYDAQAKKYLQEARRSAMIEHR